jgi:glycosidase
MLQYGDEIGIGDDLSLPERNCARTPMQWSPQRHGGFSTARRTVRPVISDPIYGYKRVNVEDQRRDPDSLLNWMERKIRRRRECPEISWGDWKILENTGARNVLVMRYEWRGHMLLILHNFSPEPRSSDSTPEPCIQGRCATCWRPTTAGRTPTAVTPSSSRPTATAGIAVEVRTETSRGTDFEVPFRTLEVRI